MSEPKTEKVDKGSVARTPADASNNDSGPISVVNSEEMEKFRKKEKKLKKEKKKKKKKDKHKHKHKHKYKDKDLVEDRDRYKKIEKTKVRKDNDIGGGKFDRISSSFKREKDSSAKVVGSGKFARVIAPSSSSKFARIVGPSSEKAKSTEKKKDKVPSKKRNLHINIERKSAKRKIEKEKHRHHKSKSSSKPEKVLSPRSLEARKIEERNKETIKFNKSKVVTYKQWKQYLPFLYEYVVVHVLSWPSLSLEWSPSKAVSADNHCSIHQLVIGVNNLSDTSPGGQYLSVCTLQLPDESVDIEEDESKLMNTEKYVAKLKMNGKFEQGSDINRIKLMPQVPEKVATICQNGDVLVIDTSERDGKDEYHLDVRLQGHTNFGYGISWSECRKGFLLTSSEDSLICMWDLNSVGNEKVSSPNQIFKGHEKGVGDVRWHYKDENVFGSVSEDSTLALWDIRSDGKKGPKQRIQGHDSQIHCLDFNRFDENYLVTGAADGTVYYWDRRKFSSKVHKFQHHTGAILQLQWYPFNGNIFATSSQDAKVCIWDTNLIGTDQSAEEALDGNAELLFLHSGHTDAVFDISWNKNVEWTMASTAEDNIVQVWSVARQIRT